VWLCGLDDIPVAAEDSCSAEEAVVGDGVGIKDTDVLEAMA
jgi:hypothetical protein